MEEAGRGVQWQRECRAPLLNPVKLSPSTMRAQQWEPRQRELTVCFLWLLLHWEGLESLFLQLKGE